MNTVFNTKPVRRGPATEREKIHEFLEREGRPEAAQIRDWIEHHPPVHAQLARHPLDRPHAEFVLASNLFE